jgi:hypothetical protein
VTRTVTSRTIDAQWRPERVAERLSEAADVLGRLPEPRSPGVYSLWPILVDAAVADSTSTRPAAPPPEAIDRMDEALGWLGWLEPDERRIVWMRAEGLPWKRITHRLGIGRTTAWHRWTTALLKITTRLNATREQNRPNNKHLNRSTGSVLQRR